MASPAQKFIYAIQAVYEGKDDMAALSGDLKSIGKIESFQKLQESFASTTSALNTAKERMRSLKSEMSKPGGAAFVAEYKVAVGEVKKLSRNLQKQKTHLSESRTALNQQGVAVGDLSGELKRLTKSTKKQGQSIVDFKRLGVRSFSEVEEEIEEVRKAYKRLEASGISAQEKIVFKERLKKQIRELKKETNGWAGALGKLQEGWLGVAGLMGAGVGVSRAVTEFATFDDALLRVKAVSASTVDELEQLKGKAEELGASTRYTNTEVAQGMAELASTGMKTTEIIETLPSALNMAAIAGGDVKTSADQLTDIMSQFNLEVEDSGRVADILVAGYTGASTSLDELSLAMKYVGPLTANLGYSLEDTTAILQSLAEAGYKGEKAGTALRGGLSQLLKPSKEAAAVLEEYQIQIYDSSGETRNFADIIDDLGKASMTPAELLTIFGQEAGPGMMALLGQGADAIRNYRGELDNIDGVSDRVAKDMESGIGGELRKTAAAFSAASTAIVDLYGPALIMIIGLVGDAASGIAGFANAVTDANPLVRILVGSLGLGAAAFAVWHLGLKHIVTALSLARAHLFTFNGVLGVTNLSLKGLPAKLMTSVQGLRAFALSSRIAGLAMRAIPLVGLIWGIYEAGKALGIWTPLLNIAQQGLIALAATIHKAALRVRWFWNVLTGDDQKAAQIANRLKEVDDMYANMFASVGKKQDQQVVGVKNSQAAITDEVSKGSQKQLDIAQKTAEEMRKVYASVAPGSSVATVEGVRKATRSKKVDEFGYTESERSDLDKQQAIARAIDKRDMSGFKKVEKDDGTFDYEIDENYKKKDNSPKKVYGNNGKWNYAYGDQKNLKDLGNGYYERITGSVNSKLAGLGDLSKLGKKSETVESKKVHEIKLGSATVTAKDEAGANAFIEELKRGGLLA